MTEKKKNDESDGGDDDLDTKIAAAIDARLAPALNSAITTHMGRLSTKLEKQFGESIAKALEAQRAAAEQGQQGGAQGGQNGGQQGGAQGQQGQRVDPEVAKLREQLERLSKEASEEKAARVAAERKSARDAVHSELRTHLEAIGVKGSLARAVIHDLEASGSLALDEESGGYRFTVKRARTKGGRPEAVAYDSLADAVKDWSQTDEAREFLPANTASGAGAKRSAVVTNPARQGFTGARPPGGDLAAQLGITESDVFGD